MYDTVYYYFYKFFIKRQDKTPKFSAACATFLVIGFDVIAIYVFLEKILLVKFIKPLDNGYSNNRFFLMLIFIPFLILALLYFNKNRTDNIIKECDNNNVLYSFKHWIYFIIIAILPLLLIFFLLR